MPTYHIHIRGIVQGVGFRPYVFRLAKEMDVRGWVANKSDGVHIVGTAPEEVLKKFYHRLVQHPPTNARITYHHAKLIAPQQFNDFYIQQSEASRHAGLCITPDFGLCDACRSELFDPASRRYHYPFITCTQCGPRYSIITGLPYDRPATTMEPYDQCWQCRSEYHDPAERRYYSQTNSCADCGIPMNLYNADGECICQDYECILVMVQNALQAGHTVGVKGVGGYLLLCDATDRLAVSTLRDKKHRPAKPLAVLYPDIEAVEKDVLVNSEEKTLLQTVAAPIVLCTVKQSIASGLCADLIAPGLNRLGVMLPYSPLLALIATSFKKPLVATSGNVSGSPILYTDMAALEELTGIADFLLSYEREIVVPQDDSVMQLSPKHQQKIILRRSRGLAPNYFSPPFTTTVTALAMGAELKSSFALLDNNRCYVSQYLGNQSAYESQQSFAHTLRHLIGLIRCEPEVILVDKHPGYVVSQAGKELAAAHHLPVYDVQHHKAHFCAVLAENELLESEAPVLGVIWDGTGYGDDGQIWGGEFFVYEEGNFHRVAHLDYFPVIAGDKMAKEPRLSALALAHANEDALALLKEKFTNQEWHYYNQLLAGKKEVQTSSMGRLLDGIASLLGICNRSTFEGEAAMRLEAFAAAKNGPGKGYSLFVENGMVKWQDMIRDVVNDVTRHAENSVVAYKVHLALAQLVAKIAAQTGANRIAFSGGVMQNALLTDLLIDELPNRHLYFHRQLSPNDECVSFGQLAFFQWQETARFYSKKNKLEILT